MKFTYIRLLFCILAAIVPTTAMALTLREANSDALIRDLNNALETKDIDKIRPWLADTFTISVSSDAEAVDIFDMLLRDERTADKVKLVSGGTDKAGRRILNVVFFEHGKKIKSIIGLTHDGKIEFVDYLNNLFGHSRYGKSRLVASLPFEMADGDKIVIKVRINQNPDTLRFMFDTGSDGMGLSKAMAARLGLEVAEKMETNIVGGVTNISISRDNEVRLPGSSVVLPAQSIGIFDEEPAHGCDGIIGLSIAQHYITRIDFERCVIDLYNFGEYDFGDKGFLVPIEVDNIILVPCGLNITGGKEVRGNFVLDTGASFNLICFSRFTRKNRLFFSGFKSDTSTRTIGIMGSLRPTRIGNVAEVTIGDNIMLNDVPVAMQLSYPEATAGEKDGSLGIGILKRFNLTIDLLRRNIHLESF